MFAILVRLTEPDQKVKPGVRDGGGAVLEAWGGANRAHAGYR